ncbi:hypothetical protein [Candidatus Electronema sp. JM]|uniref:hypothetical protein n=1 Tax=Candidatus Electronema sp. JM TaxID=3401571 RepID=UPI003AA9960B
MNRNIRSYGLAAVIAVLCLLFATNALADMGLPMLAVVWPLSWFAFIPIVGAETVIARRIASLSWQQSLVASICANIGSTLIGIPVTWIVLVLFDALATDGGMIGDFNQLSGKILAVTMKEAWLMPIEEDMYWMIPSSILFMLPFFGIASVFIERFIFIKIIKCDKSTAIKWSWLANLATYGTAMLCVAFWLAFELSCSQAHAQLSIQQSHIDGNVPIASEFRPLLERDLLAYFRASSRPSATSVEYKLLRDAPTQSGLAFPKYYAWVKVSADSKTLCEGAARMAAIERTHFEITHFIASQDIKAAPDAVGRVFPEILVPDVLTLARAAKCSK